MSIIPLFQSLKGDADTQDLTMEQKQELIENIKQLDEKGSELFFVLIKLYEMDMNADATDGLPFESKFIAKEYRFDLEKLSLQLKQILYRFAHMHVKNMDEETQISSKRKTLNV
jgi:hypothetical protein